MSRHPDIGGALFVAAVCLSVWVRRFGPRATKAGTTAVLPLISILVVRVPGAPPYDYWVAPIALIAACRRAHRDRLGDVEARCALLGDPRSQRNSASLGRSPSTISPAAASTAPDAPSGTVRAPAAPSEEAASYADILMAMRACRAWSYWPKA